jgi:hypothetical protein
MTMTHLFSDPDTECQNTAFSVCGWKLLNGSVSDPEFLSRIPDPDFLSSLISDPVSNKNNKE